jgi:DNA-binding sugar fermentation-stimulating protein
VVFVVQRPDAARFEANREVDPEFARRLTQAREAGVGVHAMQLASEPPSVSLQRAELPTDLSIG